MKTIIILLAFSFNLALAGAKLSIHLEENGATKTVVFQCEDLTECAERVKERIEDEGGCDPRVKKVVLESMYIPGLDDA